MTVHIAAAVGRGSSELDALEEAHDRVGIADYRLNRLGPIVQTARQPWITERIPDHLGCRVDRIDVLAAEAVTAVPGEEVWAGVGWAYETSDRGFFVGLHGNSETDVRYRIDASLRALFARRKADPPEISVSVSAAVCVFAPVCAVVVAVLDPRIAVGCVARRQRAARAIGTPRRASSSRR